MDEKQQALNDFKKALKAGMPNPEKDFAHLSDQLSSFYRKYLKDLKAQLKAWLELYDQMSFSDQLQVERLLNVAKVINELVGDPGINVKQSIKAHVLKQGTDAYNSVWYEMEQGNNILLDFDVLDLSYLEKLMEQPVAGKRLSKRLEDNVDNLVKASNNAISRGLLQGKGYADIARDVSTETQASYKRAVRIARTESGRVSGLATQKGYEEATNKGIDLKKMWLATLDGRTREDHQHVDGQIRDIDKMFKVGGHDALGPHQVGIASEDINCRCTTRPIVHGIAPTVRRNNITGEIEKWQSYDEWVKKANKNHEVEMSKNERADKEQYKKWKSIGVKLPSFGEWQKIKYNDINSYSDYQLAYSDKKLQRSIRSGEYNLKINGQQNKHILGHHDYLEGRSYILEKTDPQKLVNKYAGTGEIFRTSKGIWRNREYIETSEFIGAVLPQSKGQIELTRSFIIMYSQKKGTHIVPIKDRRLN